MIKSFVCQNCNIQGEFNWYPSYPEKKFCSVHCARLWQANHNNPFQGKHHTKESINKMSMAHIGKPSKRKGIPLPQITGENNPAKRLEVRRLISKRVKETHWDSSGNKNPNWRGGVSYEPYSYEFNNKLKNYIREKFNHICQLCFKSANIPHHINYNKKDNREENFILLCVSCNSKVNYNREHWIKYFGGIIYG